MNNSLSLTSQAHTTRSLDALQLETIRVVATAATGFALAGCGVYLLVRLVVNVLWGQTKLWTLSVVRRSSEMVAGAVTTLRSGNSVGTKSTPATCRLSQLAS